MEKNEKIEFGKSLERIIISGILATILLCLAYLVFKFFIVEEDYVDAGAVIFFIIITLVCLPYVINFIKVLFQKEFEFTNDGNFKIKNNDQLFNMKNFNYEFDVFNLENSTMTKFLAICGLLPAFFYLNYRLNKGMVSIVLIEKNTNKKFVIRSSNLSEIDELFIIYKNSLNRELNESELNIYQTIKSQKPKNKFELIRYKIVNILTLLVCSGIVILFIYLLLRA